MLVLDEQLLGRHLEIPLGHWYRGLVRDITDLRPGSVIKRVEVGGMSEPEGVQWLKSNWPFFNLKRSRGEHARHMSVTMSGDG